MFPRGITALAMGLFAILIGGCGTSDSTNSDSNASVAITGTVLEEKPPIPDLPWTDFSADWDTGDTSQWDHVQAIEGRLTVVTDPVAEGSHAGRFEVREGDVEPETRSPRAEVISGKRYFEGHERFFKFSFRVDSWDYDNWGIIWQVRTEGGVEPPVCLQILEDTGNIAVMHGNGEDIYWEGPSLVEGVWYDILVRVLFSETEGEVDVWLNGEEQVMEEGTGLTTMGNRPSYDKVGIYRATAATTTAIVYHDDYRITDSLPTTTAP